MISSRAGSRFCRFACRRGYGLPGAELKFTVCFLVLFTAVPFAVLFAHGTTYDIITEGVIGVKAAYDSGEPMADSRVLVFPPGQTKPAFAATTDHNGIVCFAPDQAGQWVLQVRHESGHGMRINLDIDESMGLSNPEAGGLRRLGGLQKMLMYEIRLLPPICISSKSLPLR